MSKDNIQIEAQDATTVKSTTGKISHVTETENVMIRRPVNHNEVSIMEDDLNRIREKANKINLNQAVNLPSLIGGAAIPYAIEIFADMAKGEDPSYFGFFVCVLLLIIAVWLSNKIPVLGNGNSAENKVYLKDVQDFLNKTDTSN